VEPALCEGSVSGEGVTNGTLVTEDPFSTAATVATGSCAVGIVRDSIAGAGTLAAWACCGARVSACLGSAALEAVIGADRVPDVAAAARAVVTRFDPVYGTAPEAGADFGPTETPAA
jgi:hypothetical protein